jgi:hypothetical protein
MLAVFFLVHVLVRREKERATAYISMDTTIATLKIGLQEEQHEHGQGKWEGKPKGKSDKRITESKARQKEAIATFVHIIHILLSWL